MNYRLKWSLAVVTRVTINNNGLSADSLSLSNEIQNATRMHSHHRTVVVISRCNVVNISLSWLPSYHSSIFKISLQHGVAIPPPATATLFLSGLYPFNGFSFSLFSSSSPSPQVSLEYQTLLSFSLHFFFREIRFLTLDSIFVFEKIFVTFFFLFFWLFKFWSFPTFDDQQVFFFCM